MARPFKESSGFGKSDKAQRQPVKVWEYRKTIWLSDMSAGAKLLCLALAEDVSSPGKYTAPTIEYLAKMMSTSARSVSRHIKEAQAAGFIKKSAQKLSSGHQTANRYYPRWPDWAELDKGDDIPNETGHDNLSSQENWPCHGDTPPCHDVRGRGDTVACPTYPEPSPEPSQPHTSYDSRAQQAAHQFGFPDLDQVLAASSSLDDASRAAESDSLKTRGSARASGDYSAEFEAFWEACPKAARRGGKAPVWAKWQKLRQDERLAALAGAQRWSRNAEGKDAKFIAMVQTWVNQKRWETEAEPAPQKDTATRNWFEKATA